MKPAETAERVVDDPTRCVIPASPSEEALTGTPGVTEERMGCSRAVRLRRGGKEPWRGRPGRKENRRLYQEKNAGGIEGMKGVQGGSKSVRVEVHVVWGGESEGRKDRIRSAQDRKILWRMEPGRHAGNQ